MDTQVRKVGPPPGFNPEAEYEVMNPGKGGYIDIGLKGDCLHPGKKVIRRGKALNGIVWRHVDAGNLFIRPVGSAPVPEPVSPPPPAPSVMPVAAPPLAPAAVEPAPAPPAPPAEALESASPQEAAPEPAEEAQPRGGKGGRAKK